MIVEHQGDAAKMGESFRVALQTYAILLETADAQVEETRLNKAVNDEDLQLKSKLKTAENDKVTPRKQRVTNFGHPLIRSSFGPDKDRKLTLGPSAISGQSYLLTDFRPGGI